MTNHTFILYQLTMSTVKNVNGRCNHSLITDILNGCFCLSVRGYFISNTVSKESPGSALTHKHLVSESSQLT